MVSHRMKSQDLIAILHLAAGGSQTLLKPTSTYLVLIRFDPKSGKVQDYFCVSCSHRSL